MLTHRELIFDQFTKQAVPFSKAMKDEKALRLLVEFAGASSSDTVVDVACGPGLVVCAFASTVAHATGLEFTPAMIERARNLQMEKGLTNITWEIGDIGALPHYDESFSIVTSRHAFHHLQNPRVALAEMKRVCKVGGRLVLADMVGSDVPSKAHMFDRMERLRDPSHVRALTFAEIGQLFGDLGLPGPKATSYKIEAELERLLQVSFPNDGDAEEIRRMVIDSLDDDGMGVNTRRESGKIWFSYRIVILVAEKQME